MVFTGEHFCDGTEAATGRLVADNTAAALLALYETSGKDFIPRLNGWFSGLIWDLRERTLLLFNDRYGLGRIYWHENADGLFFASEAKALLRVLPEARRLDPAGWAELFALGGTVRNRTIFSGLNLLPNASCWRFGPGGRVIERGQYFNGETWDGQPPLDIEDYYRRLKETLARVLPRYLRGPQKVALSLTAGLDTRIILANATLKSGSLPCYTFGGMNREAQDVRLSRQVAAVCQQPYQVISLNREFFRDFPSLAARSVTLTDGAFDVTGAVGLVTNRAAREIAPVRLTGNYGGEILRGNLVFKPQVLEESVFHPDFARSQREARARLAQERSCNKTSFIAFKQVPWHHYGRLALEQSQLTLRSPYLDNELVALAYQAPRDPELNRALFCRFILESNPALARIPTDFGYLGRGGIARRFRIATQWILHRTDYLFDYGMPPWLSRFDNIQRRLGVERLFLGRHKYAHFRIWYRNQLSDYVKEILLDPKTLARPYLNRRFVETMVADHISGRGNFTTEIHKLLTSEMIERHLIEQP